MSKTIELQPVTWERMIRAVEKVKERLLRATGALEQAHIPYAVVGSTAVGAWISRIDEYAVRNTAAVDLLVNRSDFPAVTMALEQAGFRSCYDKGSLHFLDNSSDKLRDAVHIFFAGEKSVPDSRWPNPELVDVELSTTHAFAHLPLEPLVSMLLSLHRLNDRVDCRDLIDVGLIDQTWASRFHPLLAARLLEILNDPRELSFSQLSTLNPQLTTPTEH